MAAYNTPSAAFSNAASYLSSSPSASRASNAIKLEIYGLFKYVTTATKPTASKPSIFDMAGRAKWDAWSGMEKKYGSTGQRDAERRYLELSKEMGWDEAAASTTTAPTPQLAPAGQNSGTDDEEIIFDSDDEDATSRPPRRPEGSAATTGGGPGSGGAMGLSVSAMARPAEVKDDSVHGVTVKGDVERLKGLLEETPALVDHTDEFGYTPLHLACDRGHLEVVKLLLEKGANKSIKDQDDFTPLELAEVAGKSDIVALLSPSG